MRRFQLHRHADVSGVSGNGLVAEGVQHSDGTVVIRWHGEHASTVIWQKIEDAILVHGHDGNTEFRFLDDEQETIQELDPASVWIIPKVPHENNWITNTGRINRLHGSLRQFLSPAEARHYAALYLAAADEAERRNGRQL